MRVTSSIVIALCLAAGVLAAMPDPAADAAAILSAARAALGGEERLSAVKSFVATGRTRQLRGNNLVPIEFEVLCELPDKYLRKDEIPAQESEPTTSGFNADALIQIPPPTEAPAAAGRPGGPATPAAAGRPAAPAAPVEYGGAPSAATPARTAAATPPQGAPDRPAVPGQPAAPAGARPDPRAARLVTVKQDFVRLTLGMFAASFSSYPLTFAHIGQAEAPQGKADILEVKGPGTFLARLFVNSETHLPVMVSWTVPATNAVVTVPGQAPPANVPPGSIIVEAPAPPAATASKDEQQKYAAEVQDLRRKALAGRLVEHRVYFADYRDIGNGIRFPFRLRRAVAADTIEETNFDRFEINRRIDPRRFQSLK
jgi:hypothetical protein